MGQYLHYNSACFIFSKNDFKYDFFFTMGMRVRPHRGSSDCCRVSTLKYTIFTSISILLLNLILFCCLFSYIFPPKIVPITYQHWPENLCFTICSTAYVLRYSSYSGPGLSKSFFGREGVAFLGPQSFEINLAALYQLNTCGC